MKKSLYIFIALTSIFLSARAQIDINNAIRFKNYDQNSGLPGETVRAIYQDSDDLIWMGVEYKGLVAFDGTEFDLFSYNEADSSSLRSNNVECIAEDTDGNLWVGTDAGLHLKKKGIHHFSSAQFECFTHHEDTLSIPDNGINCLVLNQNKDLMIGTNQGLAIYRGNGKFRRIKLGQNKEPQIHSILSLANGSSIIGTNNGIFILNNAYELHNSLLKDEIEAHKIKVIRSLCSDQSGKIWLGTDRGLFIYQPQEKKIIPINELSHQIFSSIGIDCIRTDQQGRIWVGSTSHGLFIFQKRGEKYVFMSSPALALNGFNSNQIRDIIEDSQGLIWIGTKNHGLYLHDIRLQTFGYLGFQNSGDLQLSDKNILSVFEDQKHHLFVGTRQGGLNVIDLQNQEIKYYSTANENYPLRTNRIDAITQDQNRHIWIGSLTSMVKFDPVSGSFTDLSVAPASIRVLQRDHKGQILVGTTQGIFLFDSKTKAFMPLETAGNSQETLKHGVTSIYKTGDGAIWFGTTDAGVFKYFPENKSLFHYHTEQSNPLLKTSSDQIRCIYQDSYGRIWMGTHQAGLMVQRNEHEGFVRAVSELDKTSIFSILEGAPGELWLATSNGVYKYDGNTQEIEHYGTKYGVQGEVFANTAFHKSSDGTLFFGGNNGLNYFSPKDIKKHHFTPVIHFKKINSIGNQHLEKDYQFPYGSHLSIDFFLSDYSSPSNNKYEYKFDELDAEWIPLGTRNSLSLANMNPGTYNLLVRGRNSDNIITGNEAHLQFKVLNPWWFTSLAKAIYLTFILILAYVIYRIRAFKEQKARELHLLQLQKDHEEELTRHKLRFFTNISHELRTPLTVMLPSAEQLSDDRHDSNVARHGKTLLKGVQVLISLVEELLEFRKIEQGHTQLNPQESEIIAQCRSVFNEFTSMAESRNIQYQLNTDIEEIVALVDVKVLDKILRNLLSNAFKYTHDHSAISLDISFTPQGEKSGLISISVSDSGIGISDSALPHIFDRFYRSDKATPIPKGSGIGLDLVKSLVSLHHGHIDVESEEGKGSVFTVTLPIALGSEIKAEAPDTKRENVATDQPRPEQEKEIEIDSRLCILIAEDDPEIRRMLHELFSSEYQVQIAENGREAWELVNQNSQPHLIISDIMMPEMDGLELCKMIKSHHQTSHVPVILLTAKSATEDEILGLQTGADEYITKPFYTNVLLAKVNNIMQRQTRLKTYYEKDFQPQPGDPPVFNREQELLAKCHKAIEENLDNESFGVEHLSREVGMSRAHLFRKLKYQLDQSPLDLIYTIRLKRAKQLLESGSYSMSEIAYSTGFASPGSFSTTFKKHFGISPSAYAKSRSGK